MKLYPSLASPVWQARPFQLLSDVDADARHAERDAQPPVAGQAALGHAVGAPVGAWSGVERRRQNRRSAQERRTERRPALLDTRTEFERRRGGRRVSDTAPKRGVSFKV